MPVLKPYAEATPKNGYYVLAPISGRDHPIPLQTSNVTVEVYRRLGYDPDRNGTDGVSVPNELTWKLYDVGLHWTESSGQRSTTDGLSGDHLQNDGPSLTRGEVEAVEELIHNYHRETKDKLEELVAQLKQETTSEVSTELTQQPPEAQTDSVPFLWDMDEDQIRTVGKFIESDFSERLNEGPVDVWSVDVDISEWKPGENPDKFCIAISVNHIGEHDQQYLHAMYVCEKHGLERCATATGAEKTWKNRIRIEYHRTKAIEALVRASDRFSFCLGDVHAEMNINVDRLPGIFDE